MKERCGTCAFWRKRQRGYGVCEKKVYHGTVYRTQAKCDQYQKKWAQEQLPLLLEMEKET